MRAMAVPLSPALLAGGARALRRLLLSAPGAPARGLHARGPHPALVSVSISICSDKSKEADCDKMRSASLTEKWCQISLAP